MDKKHKSIKLCKMGLHIYNTVPHCIYYLPTDTAFQHILQQLF